MSGRAVCATFDFIRTSARSRLRRGFGMSHRHSRRSTSGTSRAGSAGGRRVNMGASVDGVEAQTSGRRFRGGSTGEAGLLLLAGVHSKIVVARFNLLAPLLKEFLW